MALDEYVVLMVIMAWTYLIYGFFGNMVAFLFGVLPLIFFLKDCLA